LLSSSELEKSLRGCSVRKLTYEGASAPSHSHASSGNDAPSLISNPATPAKAGAHGKSGSRPSPGKRGGDVELHQLNESVHWVTLKSRVESGRAALGKKALDI